MYLCIPRLDSIRTSKLISGQCFFPSLALERATPHLLIHSGFDNRSRHFDYFVLTAQLPASLKAMYSIYETAKRIFPIFPEPAVFFDGPTLCTSILTMMTTLSRNEKNGKKRDLKLYISASHPHIHRINCNCSYQSKFRT